MKKISTVPTLALSALTLALTGCAGLQAPQVGDDEVRLSGELTTRSGVNFNSGSRYQTFPLRLRAGEALQVRQSGDLDAQMALLDARNTLVAGPASGSLTLAPPQDGIYTLGVSGVTASDYGPFGLSLKRIEVRNSGELVQGEHLAGLLSSTVAGNEYQLPITLASIPWIWCRQSSTVCCACKVTTLSWKMMTTALASIHASKPTWSRAAIRCVPEPSSRPVAPIH